jgi:ABC-2 type transport system ATP-binding protein
MNESTSPILRLNGLTKHYGSHAAIRDLSFDIFEGDVFGFLGPNGAGKSTTMYIIAGLVKASAGTVELFGRPLGSDPEIRRDMGALIETPAFYDYLSGQKNLEILARVHGGVPFSRTRDVLAKVGLSDRAKDRVREYSHGMKQRLGIAQALLASPKLLVLDEPTNGLDPEGSATVWELLRNLAREEKMTILVSSHLLHEVEESCNRIAVINQGILVACDNVRSLLFFNKEDNLLLFDDAEVRARAEQILRTMPGIEILAPDEAGEYPDSPSLKVRMRQGNAREVITRLAESHAVPRAVIPQRKTLKQFFLELTRRQSRLTPSSGTELGLGTTSEK